MNRTNAFGKWPKITRMAQRYFLVVPFALLLCSCDPGLHAAPVGWNKVGERTFEKNIDGLQFRTTRIGGLIGESWVDVDFVITNAAKPITAESFVLIGPLGKIQGRLSKHPYNFTSTQTRGAHMGYMGADWEFDSSKMLTDIIGHGVVVEVTFLYGDQEKTIQIKFQK